MVAKKQRKIRMIKVEDPALAVVTKAPKHIAETKPTWQMRKRTPKLQFEDVDTDCSIMRMEDTCTVTKEKSTRVVATLVMSKRRNILTSKKQSFALLRFPKRNLDNRPSSETTAPLKSKTKIQEGRSNASPQIELLSAFEPLRAEVKPSAIEAGTEARATQAHLPQEEDANAATFVVPDVIIDVFANVATFMMSFGLIDPPQDGSVLLVTDPPTDVFSFDEDSNSISSNDILSIRTMVSHVTHGTETTQGVSNRTSLTTNIQLPKFHSSLENVEPMVQSKKKTNKIQWMGKKLSSLRPTRPSKQVPEVNGDLQAIAFPEIAKTEAMPILQVEDTTEEVDKTEEVEVPVQAQEFPGVLEDIMVVLGSCHGEITSWGTDACYLEELWNAIGSTSTASSKESDSIENCKDEVADSDDRSNDASAGMLLSLNTCHLEQLWSMLSLGQEESGDQASACLKDTPPDDQRSAIVPLNHVEHESKAAEHQEQSWFLVLVDHAICTSSQHLNTSLHAIAHDDNEKDSDNEDEEEEGEGRLSVFCTAAIGSDDTEEFHVYGSQQDDTVFSGLNTLSLESQEEGGDERVPRVTSTLSNLDMNDDIRDDAPEPEPERVEIPILKIKKPHEKEISIDEKMKTMRKTTIMYGIVDDQIIQEEQIAGSVCGHNSVIESVKEPAKEDSRSDEVIGAPSSRPSPAPPTTNNESPSPLLNMFGDILPVWTPPGQLGKKESYSKDQLALESNHNVFNAPSKPPLANRPPRPVRKLLTTTILKGPKKEVEMATTEALCSVLPVTHESVSDQKASLLVASEAKIRPPSSPAFTSRQASEKEKADISSEVPPLSPSINSTHSRSSEASGRSKSSKTSKKSKTRSTKSSKPPKKASGSSPKKTRASSPPNTLGFSKVRTSPWSSLTAMSDSDRLNTIQSSVRERKMPSIEMADTDGQMFPSSATPTIRSVLDQHLHSQLSLLPQQNPHRQVTLDESAANDIPDIPSNISSLSIVSVVEKAKQTQHFRRQNLRQKRLQRESPTLFTAWGALIESIYKVSDQHNIKGQPVRKEEASGLIRSDTAKEFVEKDQQPQNTSTSSAE